MLCRLPPARGSTFVCVGLWADGGGVRRVCLRARRRSFDLDFPLRYNRPLS